MITRRPTPPGCSPFRASLALLPPRATVHAMPTTEPRLSAGDATACTQPDETATVEVWSADYQTMRELRYHAALRWAARTIGGACGDAYPFASWPACHAFLCDRYALEHGGTASALQLALLAEVAHHMHATVGDVTAALRLAARSGLCARVLALPTTRTPEPAA